MIKLVIIIVNLLTSLVFMLEGGNCQDSNFINEYSIQKQPHIFINQSDNQVIQATFGQTVALPCIVYRQINQELSNIHVIWNKLFHYQRPSILSIGRTLLKQDMRYIVRKVEHISANQRKMVDVDQVEYSKENWQFEIRRLDYEDAGKYQCSLSLAQPIAKNITLEVRPDLTIEPSAGNFKTSEKIVITCQVTLRHLSPRRKYARKHLRQPHRPYMAWYKDTPMGIKEHIKADHNETNNELRKHEIHTERQGLVFKSFLTINDANPQDSGQYRCIFEHYHQAATIKVSSGEYSHKNLLQSWVSGSTGGGRLRSSDLIWLLLFCINVFRIYFETS